MTAEAFALTAEEVDCLICAMAGAFPERYQTVRMDLLRKLAKEKRDRARERAS